MLQIRKYKRGKPAGQDSCSALIQANQMSFGLDNRLGHLDAKVQIPLIPGAKPILLPPFPSSLAK